MNPHVNRCILESEPTSVSYLDSRYFCNFKEYSKAPAHDDLGELYLGPLAALQKYLRTQKEDLDMMHLITQTVKLINLYLIWAVNPLQPRGKLHSFSWQ